MGVKGLWELLHPVARPVKLENLANRRLAIDASIWLHQFLRGMRDREGNVIDNAHLLGFFRRICKLLFYNVKPIFIFDGGTPALKRQTVAERRKKRHNDANLVKKTAEKLLAAQLRLHALEQRKAAKRKRAEDQILGVVHDSTENPNYMETGYTITTKAVKTESTATAGSGKRIKDAYILPPMETELDIIAKVRANDERFALNAEHDELQDFMEEFKKEGNLSNIDSDVFQSLPSEIQYEILSDIRARSRITSYERVEEMTRLSNTPMDFSKLQVQGVIRRNTVTHKLLNVNQALNKVDTTKPGRIASQRNREYFLVKNEGSGWALGKNPKAMQGRTADQPLHLDSEDEVLEIPSDQEVKNEIDDEEDDEEFEEVKVPGSVHVSEGQKPHVVDYNHLKTFTLNEAMKPPRQFNNPDTVNLAAIEGQDQRVQQTRHQHQQQQPQQALSLQSDIDAYVDEDEPIASVMAKFAEIEQDQERRRAQWDSHQQQQQQPVRPRTSPAAVESLRVHSDLVGDGDEAKHHGVVIPEDLVQIQQHNYGLHLVNPNTAPVPRAESPPWEIPSDTDDRVSVSTLPSESGYIQLDDDDDDEIHYGPLSDLADVAVADSSTESGIGHGNYSRALHPDQEMALPRESFIEYWTAHANPFFQERYFDDYEILIHDAVVEWNQRRVDFELQSASKKLGKCSCKDENVIEALTFWKDFLESLCMWQRAHGLRFDVEDVNGGEANVGDIDGDDELVDVVPVASRPVVGLASESTPLASAITPSMQAPRSRVLIDDDDEDEEEEEEDQELQKSNHSLSFLPATDPLILAPELDFGSSILHRATTTPSTVTRALLYKGTPTMISESASRYMDEGIALSSDFGSPLNDSGVGSLFSSPGGAGVQVATEPTSPIDDGTSFDDTTMVDIVVPDLQDRVGEEEGEVQGTVEEQDERTRMNRTSVELAEMESEKKADEKEMDDIDDDDENDEDDEDDDVDDAHKLDLANEEQDFTNLFPEMVNLLPGVLTLPPQDKAGEDALLKSSDKSLRPKMTTEEYEQADKDENQRIQTETRLLASEIKDLHDQQRKQRRDADDLTETMVAETQTLLRLFGIPYLVAPMEAEAQCADLQLRGQVEGILTEDSDVFLFGGSRVFKNMFKEEHIVECYLATDIERDLGVGRERLVQLAYLLGSDYCQGVKGVGIVTAMEILRLFPKLEEFATWWRAEKNDSLENVDLGFLANLSPADEIALEKLSKQCAKIHIPSTFPDPHVSEAYLQPLVDDDPSKFEWGIPDLDGLRDFLRQNLSWDRGEVDRVLLPIVRQMSKAFQQQPQQMVMDHFFDFSFGGVGRGGTTGGVFHSSSNATVSGVKHKSARLNKVVQGLIKKNQRDMVGKGDGNESAENEDAGEDEYGSQSAKTLSKRKPKNGATIKKRSKKDTTTVDSSAASSPTATSTVNGKHTRKRKAQTSPSHSKSVSKTTAAAAINGIESESGSTLSESSDNDGDKEHDTRPPLKKKVANKVIRPTTTGAAMSKTSKSSPKSNALAKTRQRMPKDQFCSVPAATPSSQRMPTYSQRQHHHHQSQGSRDLESDEYSTASSEDFE